MSKQLIQTLIEAQAELAAAKEAVIKAQDKERLARNAVLDAPIPSGYYHARVWLNGEFFDSCVCIDRDTVEVTKLESL